MGYTTRANVEVVLLAKRGAPMRLASDVHQVHDVGQRDRRDSRLNLIQASWVEALGGSFLADRRPFPRRLHLRLPADFGLLEQPFAFGLAGDAARHFPVPLTLTEEKEAAMGGLLVKIRRVTGRDLLSTSISLLFSPDTAREVWLSRWCRSARQLINPSGFNGGLKSLVKETSFFGTLDVIETIAD